VKTILIGLLIALSIGGLDAQNFVESTKPSFKSTFKRTWIRRATLVAGCAASLAFDTWSTRRAVSNGAVESNGMLAGSQGSPAWGRMIGIKAGVCGVSALLQETHTFKLWDSPTADWTWTAANSATASAYTWAGFHNLSLANQLASQPAVR
jgi:hypothetical protein